jgi:hypothetical protein
MQGKKAGFLHRFHFLQRIIADQALAVKLFKYSNVHVGLQVKYRQLSRFY